MPKIVYFLNKRVNTLEIQCATDAQNLPNNMIEMWKDLRQWAHCVTNFTFIRIVQTLPIRTWLFANKKFLLFPFNNKISTRSILYSPVTLEMFEKKRRIMKRPKLSVNIQLQSVPYPYLTYTLICTMLQKDGSPGKCFRNIHLDKK